MILFTGRGALATAFAERFDCLVISARAVTDEQLIPLIRAADVVVHNAAAVREVEVGDFDSNVELTLRVVRLIERWNSDARLIYISSMSILASDDSRSYARPDQMTPYAASKYRSELAVLDASGIDRVAVRMSTLFYRDPTRDGLSRMVWDAVRSAAATIFDGGVARRDFLPIGAAATYLERLATRKDQPRTVVNLASGRRTTFCEVAEFLLAVIPGLVIEDRPLDGEAPEVLAEFDLDDVRELGIVDSSWEPSVREYVRELGG